MSRRNNKLAIFERPAPVLDPLLGEKPRWCEVTKAWVGLEPLNGRELLLAQQVQAHTTLKLTTTWTPTIAAVDTACRMKIAKLTPVKPNEPKSDDNFRIFNIESLMNVREQNRELEMMVVEKT